MFTESATAGTSPPPQLLPTFQSGEVTPIQLRVVPVTSNVMSPEWVPSVTVMEQVAYCTPVTSPAPSTVAQPPLVVFQISAPVAITTPTLFFTTGTRPCVLPGWRLPYEYPGSCPSSVM